MLSEPFAHRMRPDLGGYLMSVVCAPPAMV